MLGIILLCLMSTAIYTMLNSALDMMESRYYKYIDEQNIEDFSFLPIVNYQEDYPILEINQLKQTKLKEASQEELQTIDLYILCLDSNTCNDNIYYLVSSIFTKYNINADKIKEKIDVIANKYDFTYELETAKVMKEEQYLYKAIPYNQLKNINKPYLIEGSYPKNDNEITVLARFAKINHLSIGDSYKIGTKQYKIVGYMYASDHIYPIISISNPLFDEKYNGIIFMNEKTYHEFQGIKEDLYVAKFNYLMDRKSRIDIKINDDGEITGPLSKMFNNEKDNMTISINTISRNIRIDALQLEFSSNRTFAEYFLYILLGISVFVIAVITKKRIEDERLQIGVLKALGYKSSSIAVSYLTYPVVGAIIGGTLGFFIGSPLSIILSKYYVSYYTLPIDKFSFNFNYLINCVITPLIVLSFLSFIISIYMLKKKPLELLKEGSNLKINWFSKVVSRLTKRLSFKSRFKYSLAARSFGKLLIVTLTSFATGMLIILTIIGMNLFSSMIKDSFKDLHFNYMVFYKIPITNTISNEDDYIMSTTFNITKISNSLNEEKTLKKNTSINVNGIDQNLNNVKIKDKNNDDMLMLLKEGTIIINENIKEVHDIRVGDIITISYNNLQKDLKVVGINNHYYSMSAYMLKDEVNKFLSLDVNSYNLKYTNDKKYERMNNLPSDELNNIYNIFSINDLQRNMETSLEMSNTSVYAVIAFAGLMSLIIIAVIGNIVVEENKKTISLMKVMGYDNKKIKIIVLNIYTPFVIAAYFLSIPVTIRLLKLILAVLVKDMEMSLPVTISLSGVLIGLFTLVISYYIAIGLSRRVLNKTPLSIALKRE